VIRVQRDNPPFVPGPIRVVESSLIGLRATKPSPSSVSGLALSVRTRKGAWRPLTVQASELAEWCTSVLAMLEGER
jgi:hypothetical protein